MQVTNVFRCEVDKELEEIELLFKESYQKNPERNLHLPHKMSEIEDIIKGISIRSSHKLPQLMLDSLVEDSFISDNQDVEIYRHIRYLPASFHHHDFFEVICLLDGTCTNYIADRTLEMTSGDICIIAPNTEHAISAFSDDCLLFNILVRASTFEQTFLDIVSETDLLSEFFTRTLYHSKETPYLLFHTHGELNTRNFILYAYDENQANRRYKHRMMNSIISAFFASLLREHEKDVDIPSITRSDSDENLMFILRYMQENYRTLTLKELSEFFNYSERHLQRIIKTATGISFSENMQKLKMTTAAKLLENGDTTISDISEQLGYSAVNNFRNIFKKYYGMTPIEFRNLGKNK